MERLIKADSNIGFVTNDVEELITALQLSGLDRTATLIKELQEKVRDLPDEDEG